MLSVVPRSTIRDLADRLIDGGIDHWLKDRRDAGLSYAEIAFELRTQHDVAVSHELVRQWCNPGPDGQAA